MFYENLSRICSKKNTTVTETLLKLGYSSSKGTAWKNGSIPKMKILKDVAEYLSVPVYYFFIQNGEHYESAKTNERGLTEDDLEIIAEYKKLSFEGKNAVRLMIQTEKQKIKSKSIGSGKTSVG